MVTTALFSETDLTSDDYRSVLTRLTEEYAVRPLSGHPDTGELLLHHDVSLSLSDAEMMAKVEADHGVRGTYCLMLSSPLFNSLDGNQRARIGKIESYGHEVGLLFSTHEYWEETPEADELEEEIAKQQSVLDVVVDEPSPVVSFHRPPSYIQGRRFSEFQNAFAPEYTNEITYVDDLMCAREETNQSDEQPESVHLSIHPALWMSSASEYERKIEQSVIESCRYVNRRARAEFVDPRRQ